ncbi:MAG: hypothetical protein NTU68_03265 [Actinobacteria bacterium]|nr:hypothetical protein [Actinomycetota bacterium]
METQKSVKGPRKNDRDLALAWIVRQLRWERALTGLRTGPTKVARQAA